MQYCSDKPAVNDNGVIVNSNVRNVTDSFNFKEEKTGQTDDNGTNNIEKKVRLKYLLGLGLQFVLQFLLLSQVKMQYLQQPTNIKLYDTVVTLSTQENVKLLDELKPDIKKKLTEIKINQKKRFMHKINIQIT